MVIGCFFFVDEYLKVRYSKKQMDEIWKSIPDLEGYYEASDKGRIRRSKAGTRTRIGYVHRTSTDKDGYSVANMSIRGQRVRIKVHILIAKTFIENPNNLPEVNHKNGNKQDNGVDNLEWSSTLDNIKHACNNGLRTTVGETHPSAKLTLAQVQEIRSRYKRNNRRGNGHELAKEFRVNPGTISKIIRGVIWNAPSYQRSNQSFDSSIAA